MAKLRTSEKAKKKYWIEKGKPKKKGFRILRLWDSIREGTAVADGYGWYRHANYKTMK